MRKLLAELFGTYILVFCGCGAIVINNVSGGTITHVGVALSWGFAVLIMIHAIGDVSGAHMNPAVSWGFALAGLFPWKLLPGYVIVQIAGALLACATLQFLFPEETTHLGASLPSIPPIKAFILETILTFILMFVIHGVASGAKEKGILAGVAVGSTIALEAMFAGPVCGASMNPARSIGPAIISGHLQHLWIYLAGPLLGTTLALAGQSITRPETAADLGE